ncbi:MAG: DegT/DnrJ/EryC1/StrS family aminotransferase [Acidobacteria bacterium]|nr:MAG: DegT/DnrJ/EryC1/StrS family aminotransferase [Acidobacteriota bacterium]REK01561.1 MAG: DegT/DnrJ/EryC1/StrS family aminotransferase [Acidobacteriota bacterium]REK14517.1 MAG: DegT/DnrJ/EryC1/StrS family aminotransferase [Acidobacteriota bacterium]REK45232.1 MAG: DegT/DnrJ/EryC1/StrS family aminotransferase [Acidobacteriota bacterium]
MANEANFPSGYPLASSSWDDSEIRALQRVIESGIFTMGEEVAACERDFAASVGSRFAVMVNSGSSANLLMMAAITLRKNGESLASGDEVIVPSVSWSTTFYPVSQHQLKLVFVDIDRATLNLDLDLLESAMSERTKAVLAVNLLGNPVDLVRLKAFCDERGLILLEDNCESLGATLDGKQAGTFGEMGTFSSFFSHHISTMEGGFIVTDDEEIYHILLSIRSHGWTRHLPRENLVVGTKGDDPFEESFRFVLPGYNLRPLELQGAVGREQIRKIGDFVIARRKNAKHFQGLFENNEVFAIQKETGESSWFGFALLIRPEATGLNRAEVLSRLGAEDIEVRPIVSGNFAKNEVVGLLNHRIHGSLEVSEWLDRAGFFVGNHHFDIRDKIDQLANVLSEFG